jgi:hypothetical protein
MAAIEPWYGVRLVYQLAGSARQHYEERVIVVRAEDFDNAIARAEALSKQNYEFETTIYVGYAMAFNIVDEQGETLPEGVEVFSLMRESELQPEAYLDRFHDTGNECAKK